MWRRWDRSGVTGLIGFGLATGAEPVPMRRRCGMGKSGKSRDRSGSSGKKREVCDRLSRASSLRQAPCRLGMLATPTQMGLRHWVRRALVVRVDRASVAHVAGKLKGMQPARPLLRPHRELSAVSSGSGKVTFERWRLSLRGVVGSCRATAVVEASPPPIERRPLAPLRRSVTGRSPLRRCGRGPMAGLAGIQHATWREWSPYRVVGANAPAV